MFASSCNTCTLLKGTMQQFDTQIKSSACVSWNPWLSAEMSPAEFTLVHWRLVSCWVILKVHLTPSFIYLFRPCTEHVSQHREQSVDKWMASIDFQPNLFHYHYQLLATSISQSKKTFQVLLFLLFIFTWTFFFLSLRNENVTPTLDPSRRLLLHLRCI